MTSYHVIHADEPGHAFSQGCASFVLAEHADAYSLVEAQAVALELAATCAECAGRLSVVPAEETEPAGSPRFASSSPPRGET